ncbi:MAG: dynamin [Anaerolineae bacterium]|nr:dynamin [Anaerolineae bacterium]
MENLKKPRQKLIEQIKSLLIQEKQFLVEARGESKDLALLDDLLFQIDDLFLLVVAGEFNSGKSAFINALLGESVLDTGVTPTTADITILRFNEHRAIRRDDKGNLLVELPNPVLEEISIVDTPGTNAILREHERLTSDFIPRSDLVLFITSVDRPFTESERLFLESIRDWGKKIVIIINKSDIVEKTQDLERVKEFVSSNAGKLLGIVPNIFIVSAKEGLRIKAETKSSSPQMKEIESFILTTLDTRNRFKLKLLNPLGILDNLTRKYAKLNAEQKGMIREDIGLLDDINGQISLFREDTLRSFKFRYAEIDNALLEYEKRGLEFFDNTFRLNRVMDLLNKDRIKNEFSQMVVKDLAREIDKKVTNSIDWLVDEDIKQWQIVTRKINERSVKYQDRVLHDPAAQQINLERQKIISSINREAQRIVEAFDKEAEAAQIAEEAQSAVATSAALEVSALGLGAIITAMATTASADLTGILLAGLTAALGFFILPAKRKQTKNQFSRNLADLRSRLSASMLEEFSRQVDVIIENINTTIQPYSRFIRAEENRLNDAASRLSSLSSRCEQCRLEIDQY